MKQLRLLGFTLLLSISFEVGTHAVEDVVRVNHLLDSAFAAEGSIALFVCILLGTSLLELALSSIRLIAVGASVGALPADRLNLKRVNLLMIETVRSLSAITIRLPLLIVPALIEWFRLLSIPFIVLFDRSYWAGRVDALNASRRFTREHYRIVILAGAVASLPTIAEWTIVAMTGAPGAEAPPIWLSPTQHIGSCLFFGTLKITLDAFLIWIYRRRFVEIAA